MTVRRFRHALLIAAALLALMPVAAQAAHTGTTVYAPPGKAGASEYFEDVPASGGGVRPPANLSNPSSTNINAIGNGSAKRGTERLSKLGQTGLDASRFAQATAPGPAGPESPDATTDAGSATSGFWHLLTGSDVGGIGAFLPLLLALTAAGALGYGLGRRFKPRSA